MKLSTFCGYCQFWTIIFHFSSAVIVDQGIFNHLTVQIGEDVQVHVIIRIHVNDDGMLVYMQL